MIFADVSKRERNEIIIEVISLSKNKVMQINYNNKIAYLKRTVNNEVQNIKIAKKFLSQVNSIVINENNLENIETIESNLYDKLSNEKFDIIFSNPPQMPMLSGSKHDSGGEDGRYFILRILKESIIHLNDNGELYILLFDFLGTNIQTNNEESLKNIGKKLGYSKIEIVLETPKIIKENSVTFQSLEHIKKIYPKYSFKEINGNLYFNIQILKFIK